MDCWWLLGACLVVELSGHSIGSSDPRPWVQSSMTANFSLSSISTLTIEYVHSLLHQLHIVLSVHREMRMKQKTLVSQEYYTTFVDVQIYRLATIHLVLLAMEKAGGGQY